MIHSPRPSKPWPMALGWKQSAAEISSLVASVVSTANGCATKRVLVPARPRLNSSTRLTITTLSATERIVNDDGVRVCVRGHNAGIGRGQFW